MKPWDPQTGESRQAFHAFCHYRDMGIDRTVDRGLAQHRGACLGGHPEGTRAALKRSGCWARWAAKWKWVDRAAMWDSHLDQLGQKEAEKRKAAMTRRHLEIGQMMQAKGLERFKKLTPEQAAKLPVSVAQKLLEQGVKLERSTAGEPSDVTKVIQDGEVSHTIEPAEPGLVLDLNLLTLEELRALEQLTRKATPPKA